MARIKSITLIEDPLLEPFYLKSDKDCFTLIERVQTDPNHRLSKGGDSKERSRIIGYFSRFDQCLERICKEKLNLGVDFNSVRNFLDEYKKTEETIKEYVNKVETQIIKKEVYEV